MGMSTGLIRYNLKDRGRVHVGTPRRFNIPRFMALVNGAKVQEMVRKGDMFGYLGHDIRRRFGLYPPEVALENGEVVPLEPAFVTTYIKAYDDGTVEHKARFLDTPLGKKAQEWHIAKTGGFSSVVAPNEENPTAFWGFDYVLSPNFHGNRGYAVMDGAAYDKELNRLTSKQKYQEINARQLEQQAVMDALYQQAQQTQELLKTNSRLNASLDSMARQYEEMERELADLRHTVAQNEPKFAPIARLSVSGDNWISRSVASMDDIKQISKQSRETEPATSILLDYLKV